MAGRVLDISKIQLTQPSLVELWLRLSLAILNALLDKSILVDPLIVLSASFNYIQLTFIIVIYLYQSQIIIFMRKFNNARWDNFWVIDIM